MPLDQGTSIPRRERAATQDPLRLLSLWVWPEPWEGLQEARAGLDQGRRCWMLELGLHPGENLLLNRKELLNREGRASDQVLEK